MRAWRRKWNRLFGTFFGRRREQDLADELESHLEMLVDENQRQGMGPEEARRAALQTLGNVEATKESVRDQRGLPWLETTWADLRYAVRGLHRNPGFAAAAILTLALGIGANTAIFSALYAVIFRPLPFQEPERLVKVYQERVRGRSIEGGEWEQYLRWRSESETFEDLAAYGMESHELVGHGDPRRVMSLRVSDKFFPLLGTQALLGRTLAEEDFVSGRKALVISHRLWLSAFEGDPAIVGSEVRLSGAPYTVVGVMPERFRYPPVIFQIPGMSFEAWEPLPRGYRDHAIVLGRLAPGVTLDQAKAEMDLILQRDYAQRGMARPERVEARLDPIPEIVSGHLRPAGWILLAAVGLVLLIACANVASLLLARASSRSREIAVRAAIGAGRGRLVRQALTESLLLSSVGAAVGVLWAGWVIRALIPVFPHGIPRVDEIGLNGAVLAFTAAVAVLATLLFGLAPAVGSARLAVYSSLKAGGAGSAGGLSSSRSLRWLVAGEAALAVVLLVGAGLLLRSLHALVSVDTGFRAGNVLTMRIGLSPDEYRDWRPMRTFHERVLENLRAIPEVESAALAEVLPLSGRSLRSPVVLDGTPDPSRKTYAEYDTVTPGYFRTMRLPLLEGRVLGPQDTAVSQPIAVVSRSAVERFWPGESPLGKTIRNASRYTDEVARVVVGVVEDEKHWNVWTEPDPKVYIPYAQASTRGARRSLGILTFAVMRAKGDPAALAAAARQAVWDVDSEQPIVELKPMQQLVDDSMAVQRFQSALLAGVAALALTLASIGIYGVLAFLVSRQRFEIGVRMALGAQPGEVLRGMLLRGLQPALAGGAVGLAAAGMLARLIEHELFGVEAFDAPAFGAVALMLLAVAVLACYPPARRASKVDPISALRQD